MPAGGSHRLHACLVRPTPLRGRPDADGRFSLSVPARVQTVTVFALSYARPAVPVPPGGGALDVRLSEATADLRRPS